MTSVYGLTPAIYCRYDDDRTDKRLKASLDKNNDDDNDAFANTVLHA